MSLPSSINNSHSADVVVIGAGLAGLSAARLVAHAGVDVLVLEARERVGGRTYSISADGAPLDLGGQFIGPTQRRITALAAALGVTVFPTYDSGDNIQYRDGVASRYSGLIPTDDPLVAAEVIEAMLALNMMATTVPLEAPWQAPDAATWDAQTMQSWIEANVHSTGARYWLTLMAQAVFSAEPRDLSLLHALFYIHSAGGLDVLTRTGGGAQATRFHGGAQQVSIKMAAALGDRVILGAPVHTITQHDEGVQVESDAGAATARYAIVAIPPTLAGRLRYRPVLPGRRDHLTQRMPMGSVIKVYCLYDTPFWRSAGLTGQAISDSGIVRVTFDSSPHDAAHGALMGFIEADEARLWSQRPQEERRAAVIDCLERYFGERAARPSAYYEMNWSEEEYTRGCPVAFLPPGVWSMYGEALRAPVGRLHWAGTETATEWNGYMDGALQSGRRAAVEVLAALGVSTPVVAGSPE